MHLQIARVRRRPDWPGWACAVAGVWLALVAVAVALSRYLDRPMELCLFRRLTGLACPTCGTTRGVLSLLAARPLAAWAYNPLVFTVVGVWAAIVAVRILTGRSLRLRLTARQKPFAWIIAAAAAVLLNWLYVIRYVG